MVLLSTVTNQCQSTCGEQLSARNCPFGHVRFVVVDLLKTHNTAIVDGDASGVGPVSNPEEIDLGDEDDLGGDEVPDDGDAAELEADDGAALAASATASQPPMTSVTAASRVEPQRGGGVPARQSLHASLAALQPTSDNGQQESRRAFNPEDIELPDE